MRQETGPIQMPNKEQSLAQLQEMGIDLKIVPQDENTIIQSTYDGFTRTLVVRPNEEVRLIPDPNDAIGTIIKSTTRLGPFIVIFDQNKGIGIGELMFTPPDISTDVFLAPRGTPAGEIPSHQVDFAEMTAKTQINGSSGFYEVAFTDGSSTPDRSLSVNGRYLARVTPEGSVRWLPPKATRIRRTPLGTYLREKMQNRAGIESNIEYSQDTKGSHANIEEETQQVIKEIKRSPVLIERRKKQTISNNQPSISELALTSSNPEIVEFLQATHLEIMLEINGALNDEAQASTAKARMRKALNQALITESDDNVSTAAAVEVLAIKRRVLTELGLQFVGNPTLDQVTQMFLDQARTSIEHASESDIAQQLKKLLRISSSIHLKQMKDADTAVQREQVASDIAKNMAEDYLIDLAEQHATREALDIVKKTISRPKSSSSKEQTIFVNATTSIISNQRKIIPAAEFFESKGKSPLSVGDWCVLPTRPVTMPQRRPEEGPEGLANFLFNEVLYSRQVCDRTGTQVGMSPETRKEYVDKVKYSIDNGVQIVATEYIPLAAIGNPLKRNTQGVALAEIDFMRRLAEISKAVEMYYKPGLIWIVGNEVPAFHGTDMLNLSKEYVDQFHAESTQLMRKIDPEGKRLTMLNLADMLWGTPKRQQDWMRYKKEKDSQMRDAFDNANHPQHAQITDSIRTFSYPMATCINPYMFEAADSLTTAEVIQVYSALKQITGSEIRGVGVSNEEGVSVQQLSPQQKELLRNLQNRGLGMAFNYRATMDSRDVLPAFKEVIPLHAITYTMVTKREKPVLYPNSGRGAYFPAHGEPVLIRPHGPTQRTVVTVRPWWQIATQTERYQPMYTEGRNEPLYFEEINS